MGNHTNMREDPKVFFLMDMRGLTDTQHKRMWGQAKNEYVWDDVVNVLMIQLDHSYTPRTVPSRRPSASKWTRAFHVEQDNGEDTVLEHEDQHDPHECEEVLHADIGDLQHAIEIVEVMRWRSLQLRCTSLEKGHLAGFKTTYGGSRKNQSRLRAGQITCRFGRKDQFQQPTSVG